MDQAVNWTPIPNFTAPRYLDTNLNSIQRCVNWYHQKTNDGYVLVSLPGYQLKGTVANNAACRGSKTGPASVIPLSVNGNRVYAMFYDGTSVALTGTLSTSSGLVCIAYGLSQALIVDGTYGYVVSYAGSTVTKITDSNFPASPTTCACFNGQFLVNSNTLDRWYMSAVDDGLTWTPVISGRCIQSGDRLIHIEAVKDVVYFFGENSIEVWSARDIDPYLQPISGATLPVGIIDKSALARIDNDIIFHGVAANGSTSFYRINGGQLMDIAPPFIKEKISAWVYGQPIAFAYQNGSNRFYEAYAPSNGSFNRFIYNIDEGTWLEHDSTRAVFYPININFRGSPPLGFSITDGSVYWLGNSTNPYNQNTSGTSITRILDFKIDGGMSRIFNSGIRIEGEIAHDSSSSFTLSATLTKSDDGGKSFDSGITLSKAITSGTTAQKFILSSPPLGSAIAGRIYRLTFTGPAARIILRRAEGLFRVGRF